RFTHIYPDGPAPYFSFHALGRHGALLEQWQAIKNAAGDALIAAGGTITHHHAVGRDHRPWYDQQRPNLFAAAFRAAKRELDPQGCGWRSRWVVNRARCGALTSKPSPMAAPRRARTRRRYWRWRDRVAGRPGRRNRASNRAGCRRA